MDIPSEEKLIGLLADADYIIERAKELEPVAKKYSDRDYSTSPDGLQTLYDDAYTSLSEQLESIFEDESLVPERFGMENSYMSSRMTLGPLSKKPEESRRKIVKETRKAKKVLERVKEKEYPDEKYPVRKKLPEKYLDEKLAEKCSEQFYSDNFQDAIQNAFIAVEEHLRQKSDLPQHLSGADLATEAYSPSDKVLSIGETNSEQEGVMLLMKGAFQVFRNPASHRFLDLDEGEAFEAICLANSLIRIIEDSERVV